MPTQVFSPELDSSPLCGEGCLFCFPYHSFCLLACAISSISTELIPVPARSSGSSGEVSAHKLVPFLRLGEQGGLLGNPHQDAGASSFRQCPRSTFSDPRCWHLELPPSFLPPNEGKHPSSLPGYGLSVAAPAVNQLTQSRNQGAGTRAEACCQESRTSDEPELCP